MRLSRLCRLMFLLACVAAALHVPTRWLTTGLEAQAMRGLTLGADVVQLPGAPQIMTVRGLRYPTQTEVRLLAGPSRGTLPYDRAVDFDDSDALAGLPNAAAETNAAAPWWFQNCGGGLGNYAVVRPTEYPHYHLGFEDETIVCLDLDTSTYGRLQPDMSCSSAGIDYVAEPRYLLPHLGDERIHLYVVNDYVNPKDPYNDSVYDKMPFDLKRVRVRPGSPSVRLCYKKVQEIEGPWIAAPDVPLDGSSPGVWLCWNQLGPALWDLSAWATNVREVKVTASDGASVFAIDDFLIGVQ